MGNQSEGVQATVLYRERQWVPFYWWILAFLLVALLTLQIGLNRSVVWFFVAGIILSAVAVWYLVWLSSTVVSVEVDENGIRWLIAERASLPTTVVDRAMAVPATAKRNAMGRQLDPAAYVVSHGWIPEMVMIVLDDPQDPTPYWLIGSKNPEALMSAFVPDAT